jgi:hypothetical protein
MAMIAKFGGVCKRCGQKFPAGTEIEYSKEEKRATHVVCPDGGDRPDVPQTFSRPFSVEDQLAAIQLRLTALEEKVLGKAPRANPPMPASAASPHTPWPGEEPNDGIPF